MKLNKENIQKWVDALESGQYVQGTGRLKATSPEDGIVRHCCLGVLCEVFPGVRDVGVTVRPGIVAKNHAFVDVESGRDVMYYPPISAWNWLGIPVEQHPDETMDSEIHQPSVQASKPVGVVRISHLNDSLDFSFTDIAKVLRENYLTEKEDTQNG